MTTDNKTDYPLCSVCCLSYNHSKFIEQNITSIWAQKYQNIEIIVLDDGSPDGSAELLNQLKEHSRFPMKVLTQKNTGSVSKNFNTLLAHASGAYIVFMSCDDKLVDDHIASKIRLMEQDSNMVFVASKNYYIIDDKDQVLKQDSLPHCIKDIETSIDLYNCEHENIGTFYIQNAVFRKSIVDAVGGYDEDLLGDDIVIRTKIFLYMIAHSTLTFKLLDDCGMYYRMHGGNINKNRFRQVQLVFEVLERYYANEKIPDLLINWIKNAFCNMPLGDALKMFFINEKSRSLLTNRELQYFILNLNKDIGMGIGSTSASEKKLYLEAQVHYQEVVKILREKVASGKKLKVGFCVVCSAVFPAKPLFEAMLQDDLFEPFIIVAPDVSRGAKHMNVEFDKTYTDLDLLYPQFVFKGYDKNKDKFYDFSSKPDLMYFADPYKEITHNFFGVEHFLGKDILTFHINYGYLMYQYSGEMMVLPAYSLFWKIFIESPLLHTQLREKQALKGLNTVVTGYCKMDSLAKQTKVKRTRKKIIIAPHHPIDKNSSVIQQSMLLDYADFFKQLPKLYPQIDFVFRPHPLFVLALEQAEFWGKKETADYLFELTSHKNMHYDSSGEYFDLFANSDGIIHDCGSFLVEYMFTGNPSLYVLSDKNVIAESFNVIGQKCFDYCYLSFSQEDIITFIDNVIIKEQDPKKDDRCSFVDQELKINYPKVSEHIINRIKENLLIK